MEDWYTVTKENIIEYDHRGKGFLQACNNSVNQLIASSYPHFPWVAWKFHRVPQGYWNNLQNQKEFMNWLGMSFKIFPPFHNNNVNWRTET